VIAEGLHKYLAARGITISPETLAADVLRLHPNCPMGRSMVPAMVARLHDIVTGTFSGIHRTALADDFSSKRVMPDNRPSRMIMGIAKGSAVQLFPCSTHLGIAEGIETALSAHEIFEMPVWAALSANGVRDFPVIHGLKFLRILADHDDAGISAALACGRRYEAAGVEVEIRCPPDRRSDWNDYLQKENSYASNSYKEK
jgi:putative DNA primase/helicase